MNGGVAPSRKRLYPVQHSRQRSMPATGAAGRATFVEYPGYGFVSLGLAVAPVHHCAGFCQAYTLLDVLFTLVSL